METFLKILKSLEKLRGNYFSMMDITKDHTNALYIDYDLSYSFII